MAERALAVAISSKQSSGNSSFTKDIVHKKRRKRTIITQNDLAKLEKMFNVDQWPSREKKEKLAREIGKSENFMNNWFQNRRARIRKTTLTCKDALDDRKETDNNLSVLDQKLKFHEIIFKMDSANHSLENTNENNGSSTAVNLPRTVNDILKIETTKGTASIAINEERKVDTLTENKVRIGTQNSQDIPWEMIFRKVIEMAAASEGVLRRTHPTFTVAVTDAALGIQLRDGKLIYNKEFGLDVTNVDQ